MSVMVKELKDWDKYPNGLLVMWPLLTAGAAPTTSGVVVLRLEYAENQDQVAQILAGQTPPSIQLGLTLESIDQLMRILGNAATKIRSEISESGKAN